MTDIAVVDYGMGNLRSVAKAIEHVAPQREVRHERPGSRAARRARGFPGQGAMPDCMREMDARGLARGGRRRPRATSRSSASASACRCCSSTARRATPRASACCRGGCGGFPPQEMHDAGGNKLKVPHMGWNEVHQSGAHPLWDGIPDGSRFYFVHSYFAEPARPGSHRRLQHLPFAFTCAAARGNVFAVQFHPEKSQAAGLRLLANFALWEPMPHRAQSRGGGRRARLIRSGEHAVVS